MKLSTAAKHLTAEKVSESYHHNTEKAYTDTKTGNKEKLPPNHNEIIKYSKYTPGKTQRNYQTYQTTNKNKYKIKNTPLKNTEIGGKSK